jgi:hypothetical protein
LKAASAGTTKIDFHKGLTKNNKTQKCGGGLRPSPHFWVLYGLFISWGSLMRIVDIAMQGLLRI